MSGYTDGSLQEMGVLHPGAELLSKPFSATALLERVRSLLGPQA
jgi:hypothetical protein